MKLRTIAAATALIIAHLFQPLTVPAQVPDQLQYEGTVAVGGIPFTGDGHFKFAVVDGDGLATYWSNDGSSLGGAEPTASVALSVATGRYAVALGDAALPGMMPIAGAVFANPDLRLRVWFSDGAHPFQHLAPDDPLVPVAYARLAARVAPGSVTPTELADGSVTASKLAPGAVLSQLSSAVGGIVQFSTSPTNQALIEAGLVQAGSIPIAGESWSRTLFATPPARVSPHVYWTGSDMVILGGRTTDTTSTPLVGFRYSPRSGEFAPLPTNNAPRFPASGGGADTSQWCSAWTGDTLLVWDAVLRSGRRVGTAGDRWANISTSNAPSARQAAATVWTGTEWFLWGGYRNSSSLGGGALYDPTTDAWRTISTNGAPSPREGARAVWTGSNVLLFGGGRNAPGIDTSPQHDVWRYDPRSDAWARVSPAGIQFHSPGMWGYLWTGTRLLVFGVSSSPNSTAFSSGAELDPVTGRWTALPAYTPLTGLQYASVVWTGREAIIWGGQRMRRAPEVGFASQNRGFAFDVVNRTWREITSGDVPVGRRDHAAVWTGSEMLVWGGTPSSSTPELADGGRYAPDRDRWLPIVVPPLRRQAPSVAWTGSEVIVWGGIPTPSGRHALNSGARLRLSSGRWYPMAHHRAPSLRTGHTAVWTGRELIIWGGYTADPDDRTTRQNSALNTGARYDPAVDRWTALPVDGAPSARGNHTAVWTGTEMILWGGDAMSLGGFALNTGARYDPAANRWTPTSSRVAGEDLVGRTRHAAVWTGREMLIWGGLNASGGLRYNPDTGTWSTLGKTGAPSGATASSTTVAGAFWTGDAMLAWAGTWGLYEPTIDAWKTTSAQDRVAWGSNVSAVSTASTGGHDVLFWGPSTGTIRRYDAAKNVWTRGPSQGSPPGRTGHSLVWTGDTLLVVGGFEAASNRTQPLDSSLPAFSVVRPLYLYAKP